jgi:uncharacterized protein (TIGR03437 family)
LRVNRIIAYADDSARRSPLKSNLILGFFALALGIRAQTPTVSAVANGASYSPLISPGAFAAIFGANFGDTKGIASVSVGGLNAPVYFVSSHQMNVQLPFDLRPGPTVLTVTVQGAVSAPVPVNVSAYAPALLTADASGTGMGVFTREEDPSTPVSAAAPGQTIVAYAIGLGPPDAASPTVTVGGVPAAASFAGLAPGQTAVYRVAFVVPPVGPGNRDVVISIGGVNSSAVTLPIGPMTATHVQRLNPLPGNSRGLVMTGIRRAPVTSPVTSPIASKTNANPAVSSGITYTCNSNIGSTICNTLNTTIAGLYSSAFTNAGASIYIEFGDTGLGESLTSTNTLSYSSFRNALIANETDANDVTAVTDSVPAANPYGNDTVSLPNATLRALGFSATFGLTPAQKSCMLGSTGCYDGMITISSAENDSGNLYFRTGPPITGNQYDFYTIVQHETDEVLATASCLLECSNGIAPPDLFRYHSNGTRSFAAGENNSCSSSDSGNACFSIDGVNMLQQYNNLDNGDDFGDWVSNCDTPLVQDAVGCPGVADVDISPTAEILVLDVVGFTLTNAAGVPDLTITKTHAGNFTQGQMGASYTITASNSGTAPTTGTVTVADTLPTGLTGVSITGTGWGCTQPAGPCTRSDPLTAGGSYSAITLTVNVAGNAAASVTNIATVAGGGESNTGNDTASDVTTILPLPVPDMTIAKTHTGNFTQGQTGATYTITASNSGTGPTTATVTVIDTLPAALTAVSIGGTGWGCAQPAGPCTRSDALPAGGSYAAITLTVNVAANAPASVINIATVSGGGESNTGNDTATNPATILAAPDLTIAKTHTGNFTQGQTGATYTITVSNSGTLATIGTITVIDTLPAGLTAASIGGTGWGCTQPLGPCTRRDVMAAGGSYTAITLTVNVAANAPASVINIATVSGGGEVNIGNDTATDATTILGAPPALTITKTHAPGYFTQGQLGATYLITVANNGPAPTSGAVTVTDTPSLGLTLVSLSGTGPGSGWSCPGNSCTRSDSLAAGASYPTLTATVNVAPNASSTVNSASVSGGGSASANAADPTIVVAIPAVLSIAKSHSGSFAQGQLNAVYNVAVSNQAGAGPTTGLLTVTEMLPPGLTLVSMAGTGWNCGGVTCFRSDALNGGSAYPPLTVTVNVAVTASSPQVNQVTVAGGGASNFSTASDSTVISGGVNGTLSAIAAGGSTFTYVIGEASPSLPLVITSNPSGVVFSLSPGPNLDSSVLNGTTANTPSITVNTANVTAPGLESAAVTVSVLNSSLNCASPALVAGQSVCTAVVPFTLDVQPSFFYGETSLGGGFFNLAFFGTYSFASYNPLTLYHTTLGFEGIFTTTDASRGIYLYDDASGHIWYTNPPLFPYIYDFSANAWLFYFGGNAAKGGRSFYNFGGASAAAGYIVPGFIFL